MLSADTKEKLLKQLEFYFSDSNLPRDKFLRGKTQESPEGWVDLNLICAFTRIAKLLGHDRPPEANVASDAETQQVAEVLKEHSLQLLVSEDGKRVRRAAAPVSLDEAAKQADERSLYVSPFPYNVTLDQLTSYFRELAPVNAVRLRRHVASKDFRGSIFVEFASKVDAQEVSGKHLVFEGARLRMMPKLEFIQSKIDDRHAQAAANGHAPNAKAGASAAGAAAASGPAAAPQQATTAASQAEKRQADGEADLPSAKRAKPDASEGQAGPSTDAASNSLSHPDWPREPGAVAKFVFQNPSSIPNTANLQMLRDSFGGSKAGVTNISFVQGQREGHVRFQSGAAMQAALAQLATEGEFVLLAGCPASVSRL